MRRFALIAAVMLWSAAALQSADLSSVPLMDGEPDEANMNRFGGTPWPGERLGFGYTRNASLARTGEGVFHLDTTETLNPGAFGYVFLRLTGASLGSAYADARDLTPYSELTFWVRNTTGSSFTLAIEIKDYRDSNDHRARKAFPIAGGSAWTQLTVPLDLAQLAVTGSPDLTRARLLAFVIEANQGTAVSGTMYVDDFRLTETGGSLDVDTAAAGALVDRLAQRQFRALWGVRDRATGLMPTHSAFPDLVGTNVTAGLLQVLPTAVEQGWVTLADANAYVQTLASTLASMTFTYVPRRYFDRITLASPAGNEESSVDAALLYLALYRYKSLASTGSPLKSAIETQLARFDFAAFSAAGGWRLAYFSTSGFTAGTYDGYSGEVWVISLAAHLSQTHHVAIGTHWNSGVNRTKTFLVDSARAHLVHTSTEFRPPFVQWLLPLFVKTSNRGVDSYPAASLASSPHDNAVLYQLEAHAKAAALGRATRLQPDAGDDGSGTFYRQFSYYDDFGRPELVMPWSVSFSFLADAPFATAALREILNRDLHGPFGLADSATWPSNANPATWASRHDLWNTALSTMALMQYRFGGSEDLAALPEVSGALAAVLAARTFSPAISAGVVIAASHFRDLRLRVDSLRARYGLGAFAWGSLASPIQATHVTDLRSALNQVLVAAGQSAQGWTTDPNQVRFTTVRAQDVNDLRAVITSLEQ